MPLFGVADKAGFANVFAGKADLSGGRSIVLLGNITNCPNLSPFLGSIVFVGHLKRARVAGNMMSYGTA